MASENTYTIEVEKVAADVTHFTIVVDNFRIVVNATMRPNGYVDADIHRDGMHVDSATAWVTLSPADKSYCELVDA